MMQQLQHWMLQIVSSAFLVALLQQLMPEGTVKRTGNLLGGVILLLVFLQPLTDWETPDFSMELSSCREQIEAESEEYLRQQNNQWRQLIEENTAAYIEDKAAQLGLRCSTAVQAEENEEGIPCPVRVTVIGEKDPELALFIRQQLGIEEERQTWLEN